MFCLEGLWHSVSSNCAITETRLFGNDAVVHFVVFSENHLCALSIMYVRYFPLVCSPCIRQQSQALMFALQICRAHPLPALKIKEKSECLKISHTHPLCLTFTLHQRWKSIPFSQRLQHRYKHQCNDSCFYFRSLIHFLSLLHWVQSHCD